MSELIKIKNYIESLLKSDNFLNFEKESKQAIQKFPEDIELLQYYAISLLRNNKKKESIEYFKLVINKKNKLIAPYLNIAKIYHSLNNIAEAEIYYEKAIEISDRKIEILLESSQFYKSINKKAECEQLLIESVKKNKKNINALLLISEFYFDIKDYFLAINFLLKLNTIDNKIFHAKFLLGLCYLEISNIKESRKYFTECLNLNNRSIEIYQNLIYLNYIDGKKADANKLIEAAFKIEELNPKVVEIFSLINKFSLNDSFVKKLFNAYKIEKNIQNKIIYGFALAKIHDDNNSFDDFKLLLNDSNFEKRKLFSKYNFELHLEQFDHLRNFFNQDYFQQHCNTGHIFSLKPIFIVGMPRSGSTLVEQIISSHSQVFSLGEISFFSESINEVIKSDNIEDFCKRLNNKNSNILFRDLALAYMKKVKKIHNGENKIYFTDKMLLNYKFIPLIKICFPEAKIIHTYRDPKDNCFSIYKTNFQSAFMPWAYDQKELVKFYKKYEDTLINYNNVLKNKIYNLNYENLTINTSEQVNKILNYCNLDFEENCLNFFLNKREVKTASALQVRNKIYRNSVGLWKKYNDLFPELFKNLESNFDFLS